MEDLHQYIETARRHGQTDEQIKAALLATGWNPAHITEALGDNPQPPKAPGHPKSNKRSILFGLTTVAIVIATAVIYLAVSSHKATAQLPSVTFYYKDGKTVLWQSNNTTNAPKAPYFVSLVRAELQKNYPDHSLKTGVWKVTTTLDAGLQATAEKLVADNLPNVQAKTHQHADEEATVLEDVTTGQIQALVGGVDWSNADHGQINYATSLLAPGSSIKPFDYAALIDNTSNTGAGSVVSDSQAPLPSWPCTNTAPSLAGGNCLEDYDRSVRGDMPIRYALGENRNIPAAEAAYGSVSNDNSPDKIQSVNQVIKLVDAAGAANGYNCYKAGTTIFTATNLDATQCYGPATLGDDAYLTLTDETQALATLANNGERVPQTTILSITLNGKTAVSWQKPSGAQIIKPDTAYIINDIESDPGASYLSGSCTATTCTESGDKFQRYNGWTFAVDDGTTSNGFGATMASWSPKYAVVSWIGNHAQNEDISISPESLTIPLTRGLMEAAHTGQSPVAWAKPKDIQTLPAFVPTTHIYTSVMTPSPATDLYPAWYKQP